MFSIRYALPFTRKCQFAQLLQPFSILHHSWLEGSLKEVAELADGTELKGDLEIIVGRWLS
jgi:hypothetical protein